MDPMLGLPLPAVVQPDPNKLVENFEKFCEYLDAGHEEFVVKYVKPDGAILSDVAVFDTDDPLGYYMCEGLFQNPRIQIWVKPKK